MQAWRRAGGGEVLVSESVRLALDPATPLGDRREVVAKGKEAPIEVYQRCDTIDIRHSVWKPQRSPLVAATAKRTVKTCRGERPLEKNTSTRIIGLCVKLAIEPKANPGSTPASIPCVWLGFTKAPARHWPRWQPRVCQKAFTGSLLTLR